MTVSELRAELAGRLGSAAEAGWVLQDVLDPGTSLTGADPIDPAQVEAARNLAARYLAGEPLQYVLGHWSFRTLELAVDPRVLIPRPETEQLVDLALAELERLDPSAGAEVVDLGTGSGAIALALAAEGGRARNGARRDGLRITASDVDRSALAVAAANLRALAVTDPPAARRVTLVAGDWWAALPPGLVGRVDLVVSNPPYVGLDEWDDLPAAVRREPAQALLAPDGSEGTPGFAALQGVIAGAPRWLTPDGSVVAELAPRQADAARAAARRAGFSTARVVPDAAGRPRTLVARR